MPEAAILVSRHAIDLSSPDFQKVTREFRLDVRAIDKEARTVPLSFASEEPCMRYFGLEVLGCTPEECDLSRLNNGGAALVNHNWDDQIGVTLQSALDVATKKARTVVKFSRSPRGEEIFQDVLDGIRSLVSVAYIVRAMRLVSVENDVETHRVTDWQPYEVSIVAVPMDTKVGVGRSANLPPLSAPAATKTASDKKTNIMPEILTTATAADVTNAANTAATNERARAKAIRAAAEQLMKSHPGHGDGLRSLANRAIDEGLEEPQFNAEALKILSSERLAPGAGTQEEQKRALLGLTGREQKRYGLMRAIRCAAESKPIDGFEKECSDQLAKNLGRSPLGFFVPDEVIMGQSKRRTLLAASPADGGFTVAEEQLESEFVEYLRNTAKVMGLGARLITGLQGNITIPRQLTGAVAYWCAEGASITQSSATFGQITATPRRVGTSVPYSKQFLAQTSLSAEAFVRDDSQAAIAVDLDRVAIRGIGGVEPLGILNLAAGDRSTSVAFSAAPTWPKYVDFWTQVATNNALLGSPKYLTTPASAAKAMTIAKFANTSEPIWYNGKIGVFDADWSNQFPLSGTLNQVIFGDFSQVLYLEWAGYDVVVDPFTGKKEGTVEVTIQRLMDMIIRRGKSFSISSDSGAQ